MGELADLTSIVQEILNRQDWGSGPDLTLPH